MPIQITSVIKSSPSYKAKIIAGDVLISINDNYITDVLDYMFYSAEIDTKICLLRDGNELIIDIHKSEYDDLGLEFASFLMDDKKSCLNKCIFCFIDQMPPNLRETLYFKDDDSRLSFLQGNYITLTNITQKDIDRIIKMRLNINISVHTMNPELRCRMMNNCFAGEKLIFLSQLSNAGIKMNCQIVLCPNLNDGTELEYSLDALSRLMPNIQSIAVVPVGITKFRNGLYPLECYTKINSEYTLNIIKKYQNKFLKTYGTRLVFASDEFYLLAEQPLPDGDAYEGYCQYENGVGMLRSLYDEFLDEVKNINQNIENRIISIATGMAAYGFICEIVKIICNKWENIKCYVYPIKNYFFGETITVSGLLTGQDIISQLDKKQLGNELLLSSSMLKKESELLLDDYTISDIENSLDIKIRTVKNNGYDLLTAILGID